MLINYAHKDWRVYTLDLEDIQEIFEPKMVSEGMLVRKAAECADEGLRKDLADAFLDMKKETEANDPGLWLQADIHLHNILFLMSNNERTGSIMENLTDQWHRLRLGYVALQGCTKTFIVAHEGYIQSVLAGDADKTEHQIREHLARVRDDLN